MGERAMCQSLGLLVSSVRSCVRIIDSKPLCMKHSASFSYTLQALMAQAMYKQGCHVQLQGVHRAKPRSFSLCYCDLVFKTFSSPLLSFQHASVPRSPKMVIVWVLHPSLYQSINSRMQMLCMPIFIVSLALRRILGMVR